MSRYEQTVVLLSRTAGFRVVCQACAELEPEVEVAALSAEGSLRPQDDLGWTTCPRGHRIRVIRAGAPVRAEATSPLW